MITKAQILVTQVKEFADGVDFDFADEFMPEFERDENPEYFQFWTDGEGVFERSRSLGSTDLQRKKVPQEQVTLWDSSLPNGVKGRSIQIDFVPQIHHKEDRTPERLSNQKGMTLVMSRERESLLLSIWLSFLIIAAEVLVILALLALLIRRNVTRGLKPLLSLRKEISERHVDNLHREIEIPEPPVEIEPLVIQLNQMSRRIGKQLERERQFSADVAHELKTPLAEQLSLTEVAMRWPDEVGDPATVYKEVLETGRNMQNIIGALLELSRYESGLIELEKQECSLSEIAEDSAERFSAEADAKGIEISVENTTETVVMSGRLELALTITNLISNAVHHAPENSVIRIVIGDSDLGPTLGISNVAPDLHAEDLDNMFHRLWRKDSSRTGELHAGLGLSLVVAYADILSVTISTTLSENKVFTISLSGFERG
ncbi:histidine kinase dimerization/phospho-acceptor domain-containing protein [Pseudohalioglobus lutimaris]|nr:histidine kinase dimerization/phospho-acceptor domain-containing protein [Pseudohalioglobus lutimaris]